MVMHTLENTVKKIHFTFENGLVFCDRLNEDIHISERYHIQEKASQLGPVTAVLFRRKYNEQDDITDSKPSLYIYEKENHFFNSQEHKDLHAKIWSASDIEVYIIISTTRIDIINARKPAEVKDDDLDLENLRLISDTLEQFDDLRFSALEFGKGTFWEQADFFDPQKDTFYKNQLKEENTPFHQLLEYLMVVRKHLHTAQKELSTGTIDKLLIICILVKFLEEIKDDDGKHTLRDIYTNHNIEDFAEALEGRICLAILSQLSSEFNGNIFDNFSDEEKLQIQKTDLSLVAGFLKANINLNSGQYFLWKQYSFNYLPVELISESPERRYETGRERDGRGKERRQEGRGQAGVAESKTTPPRQQRRKKAWRRAKQAKIGKFWAAEVEFCLFSVANLCRRRALTIKAEEMTTQETRKRPRTRTLP